MVKRTNYHPSSDVYLSAHIVELNDRVLGVVRIGLGVRDGRRSGMVLVLFLVPADRQVGVHEAVI